VQEPEQRAVARWASMAHGAAHAVRDRSQDNKMHTLGLFSDLNYTTINDPYDDVALRRMLSNRLGAWA
jgi:hypothetical protein